MEIISRASGTIEVMNSDEELGRKLRNHHIPQFMGFKSWKWKKFKDMGIAPEPDGVIRLPNGSVEPFWYESTLRKWKQPRPHNTGRIGAGVEGYIGPSKKNPNPRFR